MIAKEDFPMTANLGAHEVMEIHEIMNMAIDGINQFQMLMPLIRDNQLRNICSNQLSFMTQSYNTLLQLLNRQGAETAPPYRSPRANMPVYGLDHPAPQAPNANPDQLDDRDISSMMLGHHKFGASMKMHAALECADPAIRRFMQQAAVNCAEQAYEVWQYMNQQGYYQVPTMKQMTTDTMLRTYQQGATETNVPASDTFTQ